MAMKFVGSINLSDIPKSEIKWVDCKDGKKRAFLNVSVHESQKPHYAADGKLISDHFISCAPKKEKRVEGTNYIVGSLRTWEENGSGYVMPSPEEIAEAPSVDDAGQSVELPF